MISSNHCTTPLIASPSRCIDTLRMNDRDVAMLLAHMERQVARHGVADKRDQRRYRYVVSNGLAVEVRQNGNSPVRFAVWPRNLSACGLCFLHGGFLYDNTPVNAELSTMDGQHYLISGHVVRCRHVSGKVHEIAVIFDESIRPELFIDTGAQREMGPGKVKLGGMVTQYDVDPINRRFIQRVLDHLGVVYKGYDSVDEMLAQLGRFKPTLLLLDHQSTGPDFTELLRSVRERRFLGPVALLTDDTRIQSHEIYRRAGVKHVLVKPLDTGELADLLSRNLHAVDKPGADAA